MGGFDSLLSDLLRKETESYLGKNTINKIEKRLFEKYGITLTESMEDFAKLDDVLKEIFGGGSRGMLRSVLNDFCSLKNKGKKDSLVILNNPKMTEMILNMLGDKDYRKILDMLIDKSLTPYEILDKIDIPQASAYRKIDALVNSGLLVEDGKISGEAGRPAIKLATLYRGLDINIVKNKVTVQVKISRNMLQKSTIFSTLYSV
ncbi:MAG TPA: helix-turn-helix domain-containing protein [Nitrosarchaeum sp.]